MWGGLAVYAGGYTVAQIVWPFANCRRCEGSGRHRSPSGKAWRNCRKCQGNGRRLRLGRKIWNWYRDKREGKS